MSLDRQSQIELLLDRYENPLHKSALLDADVSLEGGNPGCGDIIKLYLKIDGERLSEISFEGQGCTISQASTDLLADVVLGKSIKEIDELTHDIVVELVGQEVVQNRTRCALLPLDTLKLALRKYREQQVRSQLSS